MSDLQVSLLIIGVIVVGGVTAFNWFQQWRLRRKLERSFDDKQEDVLLREGSPSQRLEPQLQTPAATVTPDTAAQPAEQAPQPPPPARPAVPAIELPDVPGFDAQVDYIAAIDAPEPVSAAGLAELHTRAAAGGRRFRIYGFNTERGEWEEAGRLSGGRYAHLRLAVQLVSRKGIVERETLATVCDALRGCAERFAGVAHCPDIDAAVATARQIDAYCAEVDVAIGLNIVAGAGESFAGTRIRALAESMGFKLEPDGLFHYRDEHRRTLFTLDNHEPAPFLPEQVKHLKTGGVTLLLDVPRVADGDAALDLMLRIGEQLARGLGGTLVDDNRMALGEKAVHAIRHQLKTIHANMEARGMHPGGERALRLFS